MRNERLSWPVSSGVIHRAPESEAYEHSAEKARHHRFPSGFHCQEVNKTKGGQKKKKTKNTETKGRRNGSTTGQKSRVKSVVNNFGHTREKRHANFLDSVMQNFMERESHICHPSATASGQWRQEWNTATTAGSAGLGKREEKNRAFFNRSQQNLTHSLEFGTPDGH